MKLYEFEGHKILARAGIDSPFFVVACDLEEARQARKRLKFPIVAKVQVLSGKRAKSGGIKICKNEKQLLSFCKDNLGRKFLPAGRQVNGEEVRFIALFEKVRIEKEYYLSITYDTSKKIPFILFSERGGVDIEEIAREDPESLLRIDIDPMFGVREKFLKNKLGDRKLADFCERLWDAFWRYDCRLIEVNPLALVRVPKVHPRGVVWESPRFHPGGELSYVAVDAKVILDDSAIARHKDLGLIPKGAISAIPTDRELEAKKIDSEDYRGSAGSTFIELDGDIAILASGGGASLLVMDSLIAAGGVPANYTEYSGNPPAEKVEKLTKVTLSKMGLSGCLVAGAVANFTDIYETLAGFSKGLLQLKPKPAYPIVIRRGGPRQQEAYKYLSRFAKKEGFDLHLFGPEVPISVACREVVKLASQFKNEKLKSRN